MVDLFGTATSGKCTWCMKFCMDIDHKPERCSRVVGTTASYSRRSRDFFLASSFRTKPLQENIRHFLLKSTFQSRNRDSRDSLLLVHLFSTGSLLLFWALAVRGSAVFMTLSTICVTVQLLQCFVRTYLYSTVLQIVLLRKLAYSSSTNLSLKKF